MVFSPFNRLLESVFALLITAALVGVLTLCSVILLGHLATQRTRTVVALGAVGQHLQVRDALHWRALAEFGLDAALERDLNDNRAEILTSAEALRRLVPADPEVRVLLVLVQRYLQVVDQQMQLVRLGKVTQAMTIGRQRGHPLEQQLRRVMARSSEVYLDTAQRFHFWITVATALTLLSGFAAVFWLTRRGERVQQRLTALQQQQQALNDLHQRDALTGVLHRSGLLAAWRAPRPELTYTVVLIDIDGLRALNEHRGRTAGDAALRDLAQTLLGQAPPGSLISRWGDDEFVVLMAREAALGVSELMAQVAAQLASPLSLTVGTASLQTSDPLERALAVAGSNLFEEKDQRWRLQTSASAQGVQTPEAFGAALERMTDPVEVQQHGLELIRLLLDFDLGVYEEVQGEWRQLHTVVGPSAEHWRALVPERLAMSSGLVGRALLSGISVATSDYWGEGGPIDASTPTTVKSTVIAPVTQGGQVVGAFGVVSLSRWRTVSPQMRRVLEMLASRLSRVLELQQAVQTVRETLEGGLLALGVALETRDAETAGHTQRVVDLAEHTGRALGLAPAALLHLRQGAYLHDIGKLAVPDAILSKPGLLSGAERAVMQQHSTRGVEIALRLPGLAPEVLEVIGGHHERWNGQGYPAGLQGLEIPLGARIFAVCDVFDALMSERPYKAAWTLEQTLAEIAAQSGHHFDPGVVTAFLALFATEFPLVRVPVGSSTIRTGAT